jgi:hypothetical protein
MDFLVELYLALVPALALVLYSVPVLLEFLYQEPGSFLDPDLESCLESPLEVAFH